MKKLLILLFAVLALATAAASVRVSDAKAGTFYCNMWNIGQTCVSGWGNTILTEIHNGGGSGYASVYCYAHHTDGTWTGGTRFVRAGETWHLYPSGYSQSVCVMQDDGYGGFPISIQTWQ